MLLVQRASTERAFPDEWEMPGGSAEASDPTIFHSVAREAFEETGLHLMRIVRQVGEGVAFPTKQKCIKLCFEIEVSEVKQSTGKSHAKDCGRSDSQAINTSGSFITNGEYEVPIVLNPSEHQKYAWLTEMDVKNAEEGDKRLSFVGKDTQPAVLTAFSTHCSAF